MATICGRACTSRPRGAPLTPPSTTASTASSTFAAAAASSSRYTALYEEMLKQALPHLHQGGREEAGRSAAHPNFD